MPRHIALLRGINLGSTRRVSMPELRELLTDAGYGDVRTLVQSGNIVLTSRQKPARVQKELEELIEGDLGVQTDVVVRTRDELADIIERNPLADIYDGDPKHLHVTFLAAKAPAKLAKLLADGDFAPDVVAVSGREIYAFHPNGLQRSALARLTADQKKLGVTATARNWNTVTKLLELADAA